MKKIKVIFTSGGEHIFRHVKSTGFSGMFFGIELEDGVMHYICGNEICEIIIGEEDDKNEIPLLR